MDYRTDSQRCPRRDGVKFDHENMTLLLEWHRSGPALNRRTSMINRLLSDDSLTPVEMVGQWPTVVVSNVGPHAPYYSISENTFGLPIRNSSGMCTLLSERLSIPKSSFAILFLRYDDTLLVPSQLRSGLPTYLDI